MLYMASDAEVNGVVTEKTVDLDHVCIIPGLMDA